MAFTNLHVHTCFSLLDSIIKPSQLVHFAKENNSAVCVTEHGTLSSFIEMQKLARQNGVKCIMGCEVYEVDNEYDKTDKQRYHLILLAKNNKGKDNLINIVSHANTKGFYGKPRISIDTIAQNQWGEGIVCCTACIQGRLRQYLDKGFEDKAVEYMQQLNSTFDKVYCELQSHDTPQDIQGNKQVYDFATKYQYQCIITSDAHMNNANDIDLHSVFVKISQDRNTNETYKDCYLQTEQDVYNIMSKQFDKSIIKKALDNVNDIVNMIEDIDVGLDNLSQMPIINIPKEFENNKDYLKHLCLATFKEKFGHMDKQAQDVRYNRILRELEVLYALDYTDYFIMLYMIVKECKRRNIALGYSRGSGANCLCLFMLNVTQIDSVRWDLDFSRFANLGRKGTLADFDFDCDKSKRQDMIQVMADLFGRDNVCQVSTFNTLTNLVAIRDVGRVLNENANSPYYNKITVNLRNEVAKLLPNITTFDENGIEIESEVALQVAIKGNKRLESIFKEFPLWFNYSVALSGLPKSRGCHASAVMVTPKPILNYCSVCYNKDGNIMYECEMHSLMDDIKLVKMDVLGLNTLTIVDKALQFANLTWNDVDINHLDLNDKEVYDKVYKNGNTTCVFQMESEEAKRMLKMANADNIEDIIVVNSANRPATKESFPTYCKNKTSDGVEVIHEDLKEMFKQSCCILLYQEQALTLLRYAGFPEIEVETARRSISKKIPQQMELLKPKFEKGLALKGWSGEQISDMWELLLRQSTYCFNRGHAVAYSLLSYLTAYLKVKYPVEFLTAYMICESDNNAKITMCCNECKKLGISITPPNINLSNIEFTSNSRQKAIMYGLGNIKGLSQKSLDIVLSKRPFKSFNHFLESLTNELSVADMNALIKSGSCNCLTHRSIEKMLLKFFDYRYVLGKEKLPPYKKANKTVVKQAIELGLVSNEQAEDKELCLQECNIYRKEQSKQQFVEKHLKEPYKWQFETLNTYLDTSMFDNIKHDDISQYDIDDYCWVAGYVSSVEKKEVKSGKSKGQKMAFIKVISKGQIYDIVVFPNKYNVYQSYLSNGELLVIMIQKTGNFSGKFDKCMTLEDYKKEINYDAK